VSIGFLLNEGRKELRTKRSEQRRRAPKEAAFEFCFCVSAAKKGAGPSCERVKE
jgi:hypothetical protein